MIDLTTITEERLALLDTAIIYHGSHAGGSGPDCKHCARELIHEVVTGQHLDATPPGCTALMTVLPALNDGPWHDDAQRTEVMRPYLRRMLSLDPTNDKPRINAVIDHLYRSVLPDICDALKLDRHSSALRDLVPIVDRQSDGAALADRAARDVLDALAALAVLANLDARAGCTDLDALAKAWARGVTEILDRICNA